MNLSALPPIGSLPAAPPAGKLKAVKAAQDFESVLLGSLLESLQKSFAGPKDDAPVGSDTYAQIGAQALASAISAHGGIGLASMILHQWQQTKVPELSVPEVPPST